MKAAIVSMGFSPRSMRLQPYRTLLEMGRQLDERGNDVVLISDGASDLPEVDVVEGIRTRRMGSVQRFRGRENAALQAVIEQERPDVIFWHFGLSSFAHQELRFPFAAHSIAVVTSPIHRPVDILRLGPSKLSVDLDLTTIQLLNAITPGYFIRRAFATGGLHGAITLSEMTRQYLVTRGVPGERTWVISPGVGPGWLDARLDETERQAMRQKMGFASGDFVVTYFGSPAPVRGLYTLVQAVEQTAQSHPEIRLLILSRRWDDQWQRQTDQLHTLVQKESLRGRMQIVDGYLQHDELIQYIHGSDAVCLPFEMMPSDVPLSILEAMALERGVISTTVACIPELLGNDRGVLVPPASAPSLAGQLMRMMADRDGVRSQGQRARAYVETHRTWDKMGDSLERVLAVMNGH
jgi:glycosyltransferase involved in cell wall biosynthesis